MPPFEEISGTYRADIRHLSPPLAASVLFGCLFCNKDTRGFYKHMADHRTMFDRTTIEEDF